MRKLMWFAIGFGIACAFCAYFYVDWLLTAAAIAAGVSLVLAVCTRWALPLRRIMVLCMGLSMGLCWFYLYDALYLHAARQASGQTLTATVYVGDYSYETDYGAAVDGWVELDGKDYAVRVYLDSDLELEPGNRILGDFKFRTTTGSAEDELYHRGNGVFLLAYQRGNVVVERCWSVPLLRYPAIWRNMMKEWILEVFPEDTAGFAVALLLGDRSGIDYETSTDFKFSGISHIIAVSGLHVSILFGLVYFLTGRKRWLTALIGIPTVVFFAAVAGFSASVTRAAIMQTVMILAMVSRKEYDPHSSLSFAGLLMLVINPLAISSVSFQLSYACMAGIICFGEPVRAWLTDKRRMGKLPRRLQSWLCSGISVSVSAAVFTTPLVALHFGTVSLVSLVTNLLTVWVVSLIFYGILAVCLFAPLHLGIAAAVAAVTAWPIRYVLAVAKLTAAFPLAAVYTKSVYIVAWLIFVYVLLVIYLCCKEKPAGLFIGLSSVMLCLCISLSWLEPTLDDARMTVLDVGQGQAILLQSQGKTYLVDCGGDYDQDAADITAETLLSQGISRLDGVILTHYDRDHSGGVEYLMKRINVDLLLLPHANDENGVGESLKAMAGDNALTVKEDLTLSFGEGEITLFAPFSYNSGNESSMSVLFKTENCAILITGDMGTAGEEMLLKYHDLPQVDALVVGHHGSKTSTSEALLEAVDPAYAFISVGENNSFGHPAQVILDRLTAFGCIVYRTDENGTIIFRR